MQKKVIMIKGIPYYERNGGVQRVRDNPELYEKSESGAVRDLGKAFKKEVKKDASDNGDRLQVRSD